MPKYLAQPKRNPYDEPVRIVYHAGERTFARLFNESSLEEVKNVVRRKLGLDKTTHVALKQIKSGQRLDLEDDDDFEAFEALLMSSPAMDIEIEVTVSSSSSSSPSSPVAMEVAVAVPEASTSTAKTPKRKRTVSFGDVTAPEAPKSTEKPSQKKQKVQEKAQAAKAAGPSDTTTVVAESAETGVTHSAEEPPKKKRAMKTVDRPAAPVASTVETEASKPAEAPPKKKKTTKIADQAITSVPSTSIVDPAEAEVSKSTKEAPKRKKAPATKTVDQSAASTSTLEPPQAEVDVRTVEPAKETKKRERKKAKESEPAPVEAPATTEHGKETETSATVGTSKPAPKRLSKQKKDVTEKASTPLVLDGAENPVNDSSSTSSEESPQPVLKKPRKSTGERGAAKGRKSEGSKRAAKPSVCASIPPTNESSRLRDEITAAILSGIVSNPSGTVQPELSVPPKTKKKEPKKPSLPSAIVQPVEPIVEPETVVDASIEATADAPTETAPVPADIPRPLKPASKAAGPACPICLQHPFHIRYCCPIVQKGPDAIRQRLEGLQSTNTGDQQALIKELEALLKDVPGAPTAKDIELGESSSTLEVSALLTPVIPTNSYLSEVRVESRDEGSSSDSSEESAAEDEVSLVVQERPARELLPVVDDDLEAVIRGPVARRQSVLDLIDQVVSDEDSEEERGEWEEDQDEEIDRSRRQLIKEKVASSDSESEEEEWKWPLPPPSEPMESDPPSAVETPVGVEDGDVVMNDSVVDPPAPEKQVEDSGEETQVEPEEAMAVDDGSIGVKAAAVDRGPSPVPVSDTLPSEVPAIQQPLESQAAQVTLETDAAITPPGDAAITPDAPAEAEPDPIEPADDLESPSTLPPPNADPIEMGSHPPEASFSDLPHSTPIPQVTKRLKTRDGKIPDDDERPISLEQFAAEAMDTVTPLPPNGRTRKKSTLMSSSQEQVAPRRSARFSSVPPSDTSAAALLMSRRQGGAKVLKTGKPAKTPAKEVEGGSNAAQNSVTSDTQVAATPVRWETLAEPASPPMVEEPLVQTDELVSSPPADDSVKPNGKPKGWPRKSAPSSASQSSQEKARLFDLTPSQVPFPYSQYRDPAPPVPFNSQEGDASTDSEEEKTLKRKPKLPIRKSNTYRGLSQLASEASLFSPRLPTPTNTSGSNGKAKEKTVAEDSSSSSDDSDSDETNGSGHIPQNRRAGSVLAKRKKSLLSRM